MSYNHTRSLSKAVGTLYRNRGPQRPEGDSIGGSGGGLGGVGSALISGLSNKPDMSTSDKRKTMREAIQQAQLGSAIQNQTMRRDMLDLYNPPGFQLQQDYKPAGNPNFEQQLWESQLVNPVQEDLKGMAKEQLDRQNTASAASTAPIGGRFSESGYRDHVKQAGRLQQDLDMSKRLMYGGMGLNAGGGMGRSFPRDPSEL